MFFRRAFTTKRCILFITVLLAGSFSVTPGTASAQKPDTRPEPNEEISVTDAELKALAQVVEKVDSLNQEAYQEMAEILQGYGLQIEQFNEIVQELQTVDDISQLDSDEATVEKVQEASKEIQTVRKEVERKIDRILRNEGWSAVRFDTLVQLINNDPQLRQRYDELKQER